MLFHLISYEAVVRAIYLPPCQSGLRLINMVTLPIPKFFRTRSSAAFIQVVPVLPAVIPNE